MKPLEGITVLDFTQFTAGPVCTYILADYGAEVISFQNPPYGDNNHYVPPTKNRQSIFIASLKHNKKNVLMNMKDPRQREIFWKMVKDADVVIDNFKAGTLQKFGITYDIMKEINPKITWVKMSGFGEVGPWRDRPAYDMAIQAGSGMMSVTGNKGGSPLKAGLSMADFVSGLYAAVNTLSAVYDAKRTGKGRFIDQAMLDGAFTLVSEQAAEYMLTGAIAEPMGSNHKEFAPYGTYEDKNGVDIAISVRTDKQFADFCQILGCEELEADERYACRLKRVEHRDVLDEIVKKQIADREADELCAALEAREIPCSRILNLKEVCESEQAKERKMLMIDCKYPDDTTIEIVGMPGKLSNLEEPKEHYCRPLGMDTIEVFSKYEDPEVVHEIFDPIIADCKEKWEARTATFS